MKKPVLFVFLFSVLCTNGCDIHKDPQKGETAVMINNSLRMALNPGGIENDSGIGRIEAGEWCLAYSGMKVVVQGVKDEKVLVVYEHDIFRSLSRSRPEKVHDPDCPNNTIFFVSKKDFHWWQGNQKWIEEEKEAAKRIIGE